MSKKQNVKKGSRAQGSRPKLALVKPLKTNIEEGNSKADQNDKDVTEELEKHDRDFQNMIVVVLKLTELNTPKYNHISEGSRNLYCRQYLVSPTDFYCEELVEIELSSSDPDLARCPCPFHDDDNESLSVDLKTGSFSCIECDTNGKNIIDFCQQLYGYDYNEIVRELAGRRDFGDHWERWRDVS